jgi:hypothetical protein
MTSALDSEINSIKRSLAQSLIAANAAGNDRNLQEHGKNSNYLYSMPDGFRLVVDIRQQHLTYTDSDDNPYAIKAPGEESSCNRENREKIFIADPYYIDNFETSFLDDIQAMVGLHPEAGRNHPWQQLPVLLLIPFLSGMHWRVIRIQMDYQNRRIDILWDDPYGAAHLLPEFVSQLLNSLKLPLELLMRSQTGDHDFQISDENLIQQLKKANQQGYNNSVDCGPIAFSNLRNYVDLNVTNTQFAQEAARLRLTVPEHYYGNHDSVIREIRRKDIERYCEVAGITSLVAKERFQTIHKLMMLKEKKIMQTAEDAAPIQIKISRLPASQVSELFEFVDLIRRQKGIETAKPYSTEELQEAYQAVSAVATLDSLNELKISNFLSIHCISIQQLQEKIDRFLKKMKTINRIPRSEVLILEQELQEIYFYLHHAEYVAYATSQGGVYHFRETYQLKLVQASIAIKNTLDPQAPTVGSGLLQIDPQRWQVINKTLKQWIQRYKVEKSYRALAKGRKFKRVGQTSGAKAGQLIQQLSKRNLEQLILKLKEPGCQNRFGLREDEIQLFRSLLNLPFKMQHATNYFYPALNSGSLDSYQELQRSNPGYVSPFSTTGNISRLGNGGFLFFRIYVDGVNADKTRYGDSSLVFNLQLLRKIGWISLHDQLIPFSSTGSTNFYWGERLLRRAAAIRLEGDPKSDKTSWRGQRYTYRRTYISNYGGKKDVQKTFGEEGGIATKLEETNFSQEIFYGEDILNGIALSVLYQLRQLEECGFRQYFLKTFANSPHPTNQIELLGRLIKGLFRMEGKYPVAIRFEEHAKEQYFIPIASSDKFQISDRVIRVRNPEGDGRYNEDLSINPEAFELGRAKAQLQKLPERIRSATLRQGKLKKRQEEYAKIIKQLEVEKKQHEETAKVDSSRYQEYMNKIKKLEIEKMRMEEIFEADKEKFEEYIEKIERLKAEKEQAEQTVEADKEEREEIIANLCDSGVNREEISDCIPTPTLLIILEGYVDLLEMEIFSFEELISTPRQKLEIIRRKPFYDLLSDEKVDFKELTSLTIEELEILKDYDIQEALFNGYSFKELIDLYRKDPLHLDCITKDIYDLVLERAPDIDPIIMEYAVQQDIDLGEIADQLGESDRMTFEMNLDNYFGHEET